MDSAVVPLTGKTAFFTLWPVGLDDSQSQASHGTHGGHYNKGRNQ